MYFIGFRIPTYYSIPAWTALSIKIIRTYLIKVHISFKIIGLCNKLVVIVWLVLVLPISKLYWYDRSHSKLRVLMTTEEPGVDVYDIIFRSPKNLCTTSNLNTLETWWLSMSPWTWQKKMIDRYSHWSVDAGRHKEMRRKTRDSCKEGWSRSLIILADSHGLWLKLLNG